MLRDEVRRRVAPHCGVHSRCWLYVMEHAVSFLSDVHWSVRTFVVVLIVLHVVALLYWIWCLVQETSKPSRQQRFAAARKRDDDFERIFTTYPKRI